MIFMDFHLKEQKSSPPADLPKAAESEVIQDEDGKQQVKEAGFFNNKSETIKDLSSFGEEEIHLPKFVEQKPQEEKEEEKHYLKDRDAALPARGKNFLLLLVVVVLGLSYGVWLLWQKGIFFKKDQQKNEATNETQESVFAEIDEDKDGLSNLQELQYGTNPKEKDSDFDGMPDGWEVKYKVNPLDYTDAMSDPDEDKLTNLEEFQYKTDPQNPDTDGDGYKDGDEVEHGYNPIGSGKLLPK
jgi:hypothetical protein